MHPSRMWCPMITAMRAHSPCNRGNPRAPPPARVVYSRVTNNTMSLPSSTQNEMRDHPRTRSTQPGRSNNSQEGSAPQETNAKHKLRSLSQTRSKPKVGPDIDDPALCSMPGNQADRGASSASQQTDCTNLQQPLDGPPPGRMGSNGQSTTDRFARTSSSRPHNPSKYPYERGRTSHASSGHKQSEIDIDRNKSIPRT